jgi:hypothetical protein
MVNVKEKGRVYELDYCLEIKELRMDGMRFGPTFVNESRVWIYDQNLNLIDEGLVVKREGENGIQYVVGNTVLDADTVEVLAKEFRKLRRERVKKMKMMLSGK